MLTPGTVKLCWHWNNDQNRRIIQASSSPVALTAQRTIDLFLMSRSRTYTKDLYHRVQNLWVALNKYNYDLSIKNPISSQTLVAQAGNPMATWEAEIRRIAVPGLPRKIVHETLSPK
jgi:hypothetical protein